MRGRPRRGSISRWCWICEFGVGWGLVGLCPGPALESLATLSPDVLVFVVAMTAGMFLHDLWQKARPKLRRDAALADG